MKRVYLAAPYRRQAELREYARKIASAGYNVVSSWLWVDDGENPGSERAAKDYHDLLKADTLVAFTEPPESDASRGGRHVEFGIALAHNKRLILVGPLENVFHCLDAVEYQFSDGLGFLAWARKQKETV